MNAKPPSLAAIDLVECHLGPDYISVDQIAVDTRLSPSEVLDVLDLLERQHGVGNYIDVSPANNVSIALRAPQQSSASAEGAE
jgi:hypothetical protein